MLILGNKNENPAEATANKQKHSLKALVFNFTKKQHTSEIKKVYVPSVVCWSAVNFEKKVLNQQHSNGAGKWITFISLCKFKFAELSFKTPNNISVTHFTSTIDCDRPTYFLESQVGHRANIRPCP